MTRVFSHPRSTLPAPGSTGLFGSTLLRAAAVGTVIGLPLWLLLRRPAAEPRQSKPVKPETQPAAPDGRVSSAPVSGGRGDGGRAGLGLLAVPRRAVRSGPYPISRRTDWLPEMEPARRQTTAYPEPPPTIAAEERGAFSGVRPDQGKRWQPELGREHLQTTAYPVPPPRYDKDR